MATRAIISIEGFTTARLYKHFDGAPAHTLPWLEAFNKDFTENRGDDPEYKFAQLLRSSIRDAEEFNLDKSKHTGWGVIPNSAFDNCGAQYYYRLMNNGTVKWSPINNTKTHEL